tara:strand:- start:199 stop:690 length:492 start_codon:yes stop_codon:yes gene_type:complete
MFHEDPVASQTLTSYDDESYWEHTGLLCQDPTDPYFGCDVDGSYGIDETVRATMRVEDKLPNEDAKKIDPLCNSLLRAVRTHYLTEHPLADAGSKTAGFQPYIEGFLRYKCVCGELLVAWLSHRQNGVVDWQSFAESTSEDTYAAAVDMRQDLAAIGLSLESD